MKKAIVTLTLLLAIVTMMTGCSQNNNDATANSQNSTTNQQTQNQTSGDSANINLTEEQAKQIAYAHAGVTANDVAAVQVKKEMDDGVEYYDVEFYTKDKEFDYEIKISDGSIWKFDSEVDHKFYNAESSQQGSAKITLEQARDAALAKVPGATAQDIHVTYEIDDGRELYEGTIYYDRMEYEFEIDAATGDFIQWEKESIFD